jgi:hypothetical protein
MVAAIAINVSMAWVIRFSLRLGVGQVDRIGADDEHVCYRESTVECPWELRL